MDEQIFAVQEYGGISRMFAELAEQYTTDPSLGVHLQPLDAVVANHYLLDDAGLAAALNVRPARNHYSALAHYFARGRRRADIDLLHSTFYLPRGLGDYRDVPKVVTVHDMIPELLERTRRRLDLLTWKRHYLTHADHIICVSESTRRDLLKVYPDIRAPITVVHHGVDKQFSPDVPPISGFPDDYVVFVGNRSAYKDAPALMRAFAGMYRDFPGLSLVFVGGGPFSRSERRTIESLGLGQVTSQVSLPEGHMASAYAHAVMCVFPSQYEGFGLPALEAMACGAPLILARSSSLPEVGGEAALYFPPGDGDELADQMRLIMSEPAERRRLRTLGLERVKGFGWNRAARQTADVYAQTIQEFNGTR